MNVLSLFDGISCCRIALERAGIEVDKYYASEIDQNAVKISQDNYPDIIQLGDVLGVEGKNLPQIDLLTAGSPCQSFSMAGGQVGFDDPRGKLFFEVVRLIKECKPKYFFIENVRMKKEFLDVFIKYLGVEPILINSSLVSAQNRNRYYFTNIPNVVQPENKNIMLKDIVLPDGYPVALHNIYGGFKEKTPRVFEDKSPTIRTSSGGGHIPSFVKEEWIHSDKAIEYMNRRTKDGNRTHWEFGHHSDINKDKSAAVVANFFKGVPCNVLKDWDCIRKFHPIECEKLQTIPENYTAVEGVSNTARYKAIGNAWTVDVVAHIFKNISEGKI